MGKRLLGVPKFRHDCTQCEFLGTFHGLDHYRCGSELGDSLIARRSDEGSDYSSLCDFGNRVQSAVVAEINGLEYREAGVIALWRMLPTLILNGRN